MSKTFKNQRPFIIPQTKLPHTLGRKLFFMKKRDGFEDKSWSEYFAYLASRDITLQETPREQVEEGTKEHLMGMWMENFADNLPYLRNGDGTKFEVPSDSVTHTIAELAEPTPIIDKQPPKSSAIVVGRGPSVYKNRYIIDGKPACHLDLLAKAVKEETYNGAVCTTDAMLIPLLERDVIPEIACTVDGSILIKKWFDHPLVKEYGPKIKIILPTTVNNEAYRTAIANKCKVYWFNPMMDLPTKIESFSRLMAYLAKPKNQKNEPIVTTQCGGNCGSAAWINAMALLKRAPIALIGIDFGYPEGTNLEATPYFSGMKPYLDKEPQLMPSVYVKIHHPYFKTDSYYDNAFAHYRQAFIEMHDQIEPWYMYYGGTVNASEGGTLWGPRITCMTFEAFLEKYPK